MKVAITGGTGFIGRALVLRHLAEGDTVRLLSRQPAQLTGFSDSVTVWSGDLVSPDNSTLLSRFVAGSDVLYHCAGEVLNPCRMTSLHIDGTLKLAGAAAGNVGHWVQLSSCGAYGRCRRGAITEETPLRPDGIYESTKAQSDLLVQEAAAGGAFSCSILRPSNVFGPEMKNRSLREMTALIDRGIFFFIGSRGASANYIFLDNVVEALITCARMRSVGGRVYNLSDTRTIEEFTGIIADSIGTSRPGMRIPETLARSIARTFGKLKGFPLTESRVDALTNRTTYPSTRIEKELGYRQPMTMDRALCTVVSSWKNTT